MTPCRFSEQAGCKECKAISYKNCQLFKKEYIKFLGKELSPFSGRNVTLPKETVVWSRDENVAKSLALLKAIEVGEPVQKFDLNQVFQIVLRTTEVELPKVVYLEVGKSSVDREKLTSILESFIASLSLRNAFVYMYKTPAGMALTSYHQYD